MPSKKKTTKRSSKKTAKKRPARKKTAAKKKTAGSVKRVLVCADDERCFWTTDGQILSSLTELRDALQKMSDKTFAHHVNKEKNDFADWIETVLEDKQLSDLLRRSRKPTTARTVIVRRLKVYDL